MTGAVVGARESGLVRPWRWARAGRMRGSAKGSMKSMFQVKRAIFVISAPWLSWAISVAPGGFETQEEVAGSKA